MAESWKVKGTYFEACNCATACPCVFLSAPTDGSCTALIAWHIDEGNFGGVQLNGLNVALLGAAPGHMQLPNGRSRSIWTTMRARINKMRWAQSFPDRPAATLPHSVR